MNFARMALAGALLSLGLSGAAMAQASAPDKPFISLGDEQRARSTYIIRLSDEVSAERVPSRAEDLTNRAGGVLRHSYTKAFHGFAATMSSTALARLLRDNDDIVSVQRDSVDWAFKPTCPGHPSCGGSEPSGGGDSITVCGVTTKTSEYPWGVDRVDAEKAHGADKCGAGVDIYVLDTGVDIDHPDLVDKLKGSWNCTQSGCPEGGVDDKNGHGTHVAGTAAAALGNGGVIGVAPMANLYAVKVLGNSGIGFRSDIMAGIDFVAGRVTLDSLHAPVVINMSIGGSRGTPSGSESCTASGYLGGSDDYYRTICNAANAGVVFAVAAGNESQDTAGVAPAGYADAVITVSATDKNNILASFSNYGSAVDVAAPGVSIVSDKKGGGTTTMSGTSMASPHVAGAVALWLAEQATQPTGYSAFAGAQTAIRDSGTVKVANGSSAKVNLLNAATLVGVTSVP